MECSCGGKQWSVTHTRRLVGRIERRRSCLDCGERVTTEEVVKLSRAAADDMDRPTQPEPCKPAVDGISSVRPTGTPRDASRLGDDYQPSPPTEPTWHPPGSQGKIEVLRQRMERGEGLFHPLDSDYLQAEHITEPRYVPGIREFALVAG